MTGNPPNLPPLLAKRWKALLLTVVLNVLAFEAISGFALFFLKPFVSDMSLIGQVHWIAGLAFALPYSIYQWRHYQRVRPHQSSLRYKVGLATFFLMCAVIVSGALLIFEWRGVAFRVVDLSHIMAGFAILIVLVTHLVLVGRVSQAASGDPIGVARAIFRRALIVPSVLGTFATILLLFAK